MARSKQPMQEKKRASGRKKKVHKQGKTHKMSTMRYIVTMESNIFPLLLLQWFSVSITLWKLWMGGGLSPIPYFLGREPKIEKNHRFFAIIFLDCNVVLKCCANCFWLSRFLYIFILHNKLSYEWDKFVLLHCFVCLSIIVRADGALRWHSTWFALNVFNTMCLDSG